MPCLRGRCGPLQRSYWSRSEKSFWGSILRGHGCEIATISLFMWAWEVWTWSRNLGGLWRSRSSILPKRRRCSTTYTSGSTRIHRSDRRLRPGRCGRRYPQLVTWAYALHQPERAWQTLLRQTYHGHATVAGSRFGIWSGADGFFSSLGNAWDSVATPMTDWP